MYYLPVKFLRIHTIYTPKRMSVFLQALTTNWTHRNGVLFMLTDASGVEYWAFTLQTPCLSNVRIQTHR